MLHRHDKLNYRTSFQFITTVTRVRGRWFVSEDFCKEVLRIFEWYREQNHIECYGYVLMPDHLHAILSQRTETGTVSKMIGSFKSYTSRHPVLPDYPETKLWRDYYDTVPIPGPDAVNTKLDYMYQNPLRAGLVDRKADYPWSSIRAFDGNEKSVVTLGAIRAKNVAGLETHNGEEKE